MILPCKPKDQVSPASIYSYLNSYGFPIGYGLPIGKNGKINTSHAIPCLIKQIPKLTYLQVISFIYLEYYHQVTVPLSPKNERCLELLSHMAILFYFLQYWILSLFHYTCRMKCHSRFNSQFLSRTTTVLIHFFCYLSAESVVIRNNLPQCY